MKACGNDPKELKLNLMQGSVNLSKMEYQYDLQNEKLEEERL